MDSILTSIKLMLGIGEEYAHFDGAIIAHINSALFTLWQNGVGPSTCFKITSDEQTWQDFIGDSDDYEMVKTYIYEKVKMNFDPPTSSFVMDAMKRQSDEELWRLNIQAEMEAINDGN